MRPTRPAAPPLSAPPAPRPSRAWPLLLAAALASLPSAGAARADGPSIGVGLRTSMVLNTDRGRDPVDASDWLIGVGLYADIAPLPSLLIPGDRLRLGLEWMTQSNTDDLYDTLEVTTHQDHAMATLDYGYEALPWLTPYARVALGVAFHELALVSSAATYRDRDDWLLTGHAGGGVEVIIPYEAWGGDDDTLGLRLESGHTLRADPSFEVARPTTTPEDADPMTTRGADLGTLPTNGWYLTLDVFGRF